MKIKKPAYSPADAIAFDRITQLAHENWMFGEDNSNTSVKFNPKLVENIYENEIINSGFSHKRSIALESNEYLERYLWPYFDENASRQHILSVCVMVNEKARGNIPIWKHIFTMQYLQRCLLWFIDLMSMLLTRRFLHSLMDSMHLLVLCEFYTEKISAKSMVMHFPNMQAFVELIKIFKMYYNFQIEDSTGDQVDEYSFDSQHCDQINRLQMLVYSLFKENPNMKELATTNVAKIENNENLKKWLSLLKPDELYTLISRFHLLPLKEKLNSFKDDEEPEKKKMKYDFDEKALNFYSSFTQDTEIMIRVMLQTLSKRKSHLRELNEMSLYPTEDLIWDESRVPIEYYSGEECLALPKLNLQFLTLQDYLWRNFTLFSLESAYNIRQDLEDSIMRMKPWAAEQGQTVFDGWSRMALPIQSFSIIEVAKPALGTSYPARVRGDLRVTLMGLREDVRKEWENLRRHDPCFLITIRPSQHRGWKYNKSEPFCPQFGVIYVRGCEIQGQVDVEGKLIPDEERFGFIPGKTIDKQTYAQNSPTWRVLLDPCQYQLDLDRIANEQNKIGKLKEQLASAKRVGKSEEFVNKIEKEILVAEEEARMSEDVYDTFNVVVRRKPKENNFKAVLETIKDLMNVKSVVPDWLLDLLMGYLDPAEAHYSRQLDKYEPYQSWADTFLDAKHVVRSFPQYKVHFKTSENNSSDEEIPPPYMFEFPGLKEDPTVHIEAMMPTEQIVKTNADAIAEKMDAEDGTKPELQVISTVKKVEPPWELMPSKKHFLVKKPGNRVRFTPRQVEAIRSGMQSGLSIIVGPPGTGKTDVAVQIIHNLYHNYPNQRILIVTHSNQALNQLFEKIIALDIDERHLLRLGHGEESLDTEKDFSRYGRVDYILSKRLELLEEVMRLSNSICGGYSSAAAVKPAESDADLAQQEARDKLSLTKRINDDLKMYTCETAQYFFVQTILASWERFIDEMSVYQASLKKGETYDPNVIRKAFPFLAFFTEQMNPTEEITEKFFPGESFNEDMGIARACFRHIHSIFTKLDEFRAFELMRSGIERTNYLLVQEAKIIAMTCTHAALRRRDLVELQFTYDTIIMEESAQILEIETFIPLLLQNPDMQGENRLKRWIMIGDHNQLPPVVKNQAFSNYSNMSQSLFTRLVKLGVPSILLDAQGRSRPCLSKLYSWRYENLVDLPHVTELPQFRVSNPGFLYDFQLVNVEPYKGVGESEPSPFFYQNLAEAEYVVATYMYMRILGYPADRISILTTYNGQKHLLRDVVKTRCTDNPLFGEPKKITTVDKFQGQQNDYILLSLVRTKTVGHLRDVRRLVVALSRARLGLYVFARVNQFTSCQELKPAMDRLLKRDQSNKHPTAVAQKLALLPTEIFADPYHADLSDASVRLSEKAEEFASDAVCPSDMPDMVTKVKELYESRLQELLQRLPESVRKSLEEQESKPQEVVQT